VHLAELEKTDLHVIHAIHVTRTSLAQPVLSEAQPLLGARVSKTALLAPSTETHAQRATIVHHALSIVMLDQLASSKTVRHALLTATHAQRATIVHHVLSIVTHVRHLALSIEQTHADHASSMTAHASSTATTATTAPTVVQIALTA
jgi:hypothetical protein